MSEQLVVISGLVRKDKELARNVLRSVAEQLGTQIPGALPVEPKISDDQRSVRDYRRFKEEQVRSLHNVQRCLYFARVDVNIRSRTGYEECTKYLVSKSRLTGLLDGDDWMVISWTAPITAHILGKPVDTRFEWGPPRQAIREFHVIGAAEFGEILPVMVDTTYRLDSGEYFLKNENMLVEAPATALSGLLQTKRPQEEYRRTTIFGLGEIIELADVTQREAMHLPFRDTIILEGPPGSGKTSIGLMRIPCLVDRQWVELNLRPDQDRPFHRYDTMQVLVMNEQMITYLQRLMDSVGVLGIPVRTMTQFCRELCRLAGVPGGRPTNESHGLTRVKFHRQMLDLYWNAFRCWVKEWWAQTSEGILKQLSEISSQHGPSLVRELGQWVRSVHEAERPREWAGLNLAARLATWRGAAEAGDSFEDGGHGRGSRQPRGDGLAEKPQVPVELRDVCRRAVREAFNHATIVSYVLDDDSFDGLVEKALGGTDKASVVRTEWEKQIEGRAPFMSEADLALAAWLAARTMLVPLRDGHSFIGGVAPPLTHAVVDEAQDIAPVHTQMLSKLVDPNGTMTLVGDLRQRVSSQGHFAQWEELELRLPRRAVFTVNHRQSRPLGEFVGALYRLLYNEEPTWRPSDRANAPRPRVRVHRGDEGLVAAIAAEVLHWRDAIPGATVAVLCHGASRSDLLTVSRQIQDHLADSLTQVRFALGKARSHELSQTDCAIVTSVISTKGLEFDAVVVIDPSRAWLRPLNQMSTIRRNALYVAASRAKQGLSLIVDDGALLLAEGDLDPYCDRIAN
jgi:hypothetical protein